MCRRVTAFWRASASRRPGVLALFAQCAEQGIVARPMETRDYLGHERLLLMGSTNMAGWRKRLFVLRARNAQSAAQFFQRPSNRVVQMGAEIECYAPLDAKRDRCCAIIGNTVKRGALCATVPAVRLPR